MIFIYNINFLELLEFQKKGALLIDLRSYNDFINFHIPNSQHIHFFQNFPKNKMIIFICEHGQKAKEYAYYYRNYHVDCYYLEGGIAMYIQGLNQNNYY